jgi:hypothetical protein
MRADDQVPPLSPSSQLMCSAPTDCGGSMRFGTDLGGIDGWQDGVACAMTGSFGGIHSIMMRCLGNNPTRSFTLTPPGGLEMAGFGLAIATPRRHRMADPPVHDVIFAGAPAGAGHIVALTPGTASDITPHVMNVTALGSALAVGRFRAADGVTELLVVAGSTSGTIVALHGDPRVGRAMQPLGCFAQTEPGFGLALTTADLDGDGSDEIVVGDGVENTGRADVVHVYSTSQAMGISTCDNSWPEVSSVHCADVAARGVTCSQLASGFGSALAAGDLDGDGRDELLVGAHFASVDGIDHAGAVYVMRATGSGASLTLSTASVLRDSAPSADTELGRQVRVALLGAREEAIATAQGAAAVRVFLCTGIPGDRPGDNGLSSECR